MPPRTVVALTLSLAFLATACANEDPTELVIVEPSELPCSGVNEVGIWESVPPDDSCDWFEYAGKTMYEFPHSLGRVPAEFFAYMSFSPDGALAGQPGGDTFLLIDATEDSVTFKNGTNQRFYLRVVLE